MNRMQKYAETDINNMKIWAFYLAQKKWGMKPNECMRVFEKNRLFDCIHDGYDYLHLMSYKNVVDELEDIMKCREAKKK